MTRQQEYEAKLLREARQIKLCRIILFILFLSLWELTASLGMINRFIFSCPSQILLCLFHMFLDKSLFLHTGVTLTETLVSFFLCTLISLITALFLWSDPLAAQVFEPFLVLLNSLPKSALAPLLLVWLGSRMRMVVTAAVICFCNISVFVHKRKVVSRFWGNHLDCSCCGQVYFTLILHDFIAIFFFIFRLFLPVLPLFPFQPTCIRRLSSGLL